MLLYSAQMSTKWFEILERRVHPSSRVVRFGESYDEMDQHFTKTLYVLVKTSIFAYELQRGAMKT